MDQSIKHADQSFGKDQVSLSEGGQAVPSRTKVDHPLLTKKRVLYLGLALFTMAIILGASFLLLPRPITKWSSTQPNRLALGYSSPIIANGLVYMLYTDAGENTVYALDMNSGQVKWSYRIDGLIPYSPASPNPLIVANGIMYVLSHDDITGQDTLSALDATSGQEKWLYQQKSLLSLPTVANGVVYIQSPDGNLSALDAFSGHQIWTEQVAGIYLATPMVANGMIYIATEDQAKNAGTVSALDAVSGRTKWSVLDATTTSSIGQFTVAHRLVYIATNDASPQVLALDAFSGSTKWSSSIESANTSEGTEFVSFSFQIVNGRAYINYEGVVSSNGNSGTDTLYALDAQTGRQIWSTPMAYPVNFEIKLLIFG